MIVFCVRVLCFLVTVLAFAHPMGNFSVSHYSKIQVQPSRMVIDYVLDLAELPTLELAQKWNVPANTPQAQLQNLARTEAGRWAQNLDITVDGKKVTPQVETARLTVSDGAGNMPVYRIAMKLYSAAEPGKLVYRDRNYAERSGWKEMVVLASDGASLQSNSAGIEDRSAALTAYPQDPDVAPPQVLEARAEWTAPRAAAPVVATGPAASLDKVQPTAPPLATTPHGTAEAGSVARGDFLSDLLGRKELDLGLILTGILVAFGLGATHALSPGHGKTMVAAYLVGSRGTAKHALILGATVTVTHTISVFALGFVTLFLAQYILPETLYPVLGAISGLTIVWVGSLMLYRRVRSLKGHSHSHSHDGHTHHHHDDGHTHDHEHHHGPGGHTHVPEGDITLGSLLALGASGGLVPCPSGLVLLLSSVAIGRVGLGLVLLTAFSAGLAVILTLIGVAVVYAKQWLPDRHKTASSPLVRIVPVFSAAVVVIIGVLMTAVSLGIIHPNRLTG